MEDEVYRAIKRIELLEWIDAIVPLLRSLGMNVNYPFGCKTFRDFLKEFKKTLR